MTRQVGGAEQAGGAARYWGVIPAAGIGARMGGSLPKQYLELDGTSVLEHSVSRLLARPDLVAVVVVIHPDDAHWRRLPLSDDPRVITVEGGRRRCDSVLAGLNELTLRAAADDWVLVHDAARPCAHPDSLEQLCSAVVDHPVGGLLGVPVVDTLKRVDAGGVVECTESRRGLWQAHTPQAFRYQLLHQCLARAIVRGAEVTDEASALEWAGHRPLMVSGRSDNLKITRPEDLALARSILAQQGQQP